MTSSGVFEMKNNGKVTETAVHLHDAYWESDDSKGTERRRDS